jgi:uncharacterized protein
VDEIPDEGLHCSVDEPGTVLGLENDLFVHQAGPVHGDFFVQVVSQELIVRGTFTAVLEFKCARCLDFFSTRVGDSSFLRAYPVGKSTFEVDLTDDLREAVLLDLPHHPVCREACKGLCPHCGENLNSGPCGCTEESGGGLWNALDGLDLKE